MNEAERERYLQILHRHDGATGWESPPDFDHTATIQRLRSVAPRGGRYSGRQLFGQVFLSSPPLAAGMVLPATVLLRISNWGNLATVSDEAALTEAGLRQVKELLTQHGYVYIAPQILALAYTGKLPTNGTVSWWLRYFDWI